MNLVYNNSPVEELAVLNGYSHLNPNIDYIGFDGLSMHPEFVDEEHSQFIRRRRSRSSGGGFRSFLDSVGLSPQAAAQRRQLRMRKQSMAEREMRNRSREAQANIRLQQEAVRASSRTPSGSAELSQILSTPSVAPAAKTSVTAPAAISTDKAKGWKSLKTWQKGAIIGGGVLLLAGAGYAIYKSQQK